MLLEWGTRSFKMKSYIRSHIQRKRRNIKTGTSCLAMTTFSTSSNAPGSSTTVHSYTNSLPASREFTFLWIELCSLLIQCLECMAENSLSSFMSRTLTTNCVSLRSPSNRRSSKTLSRDPLLTARKWVTGIGWIMKMMLKKIINRVPPGDVYNLILVPK